MKHIYRGLNKKNKYAYTVGEAFEVFGNEFFRHTNCRSQNSINTKSSHIRTVSRVACIAGKQVSDITLKDIEKLAAETGVNHEKLAILSKFIQFLLDAHKIGTHNAVQEYLDSHPVKRKVEPQKPNGHLSREP